MSKTMGLETLLEAAKYIEYRAEVEARGEKGFSDLSTKCSSPGIISPSPLTNGFMTSQPRGIVQNGLHYPSQSHSLPSLKSSSVGLVPESLNSVETERSSYRLISSGSHSPEFEYEFIGSTSRLAKSVSPNTISGLNNRNSGTREVHNKLEKNRRAHLKECFELLKSHLPAIDDRKISNLAILRSSLRHIQTLKRKERELEHEMERLARDKIALQQRLQLMKKDMAGQWDQLDWRMNSEGIDLEMDGIDCRRSPTSTVTTTSPDRMLLEHRYSESSDSSSPTGNTSLTSRHDLEFDDYSEGDSQYPLSLTVNNCHITDQKLGKKYYMQVNGVNGMPGKISINPINTSTTTKLSSPPLVTLSVDKLKETSPTGSTPYLCTTANNSGKKNGFTVLGNAAILVNSNLDLPHGQYYETKKMCK